MKTRSLVPVVLVAALAPAFLSVTARARVATPASVVRIEERRLAGLSEESMLAPPLPEEGAVEAPVGPAGPPRPPTLRESFADDPPPRDASPRPTREEWRMATAMALDGASSRCRAQRVREWLRVRCEYVSAQEIALLSGRRDGTFLAVQKRSADWFGDTAESIVISLRPGDRRVIALTGVEMGRYMTNGPSTDALLSEQWVDGEPAPLVVLSE